MKKKYSIGIVFMTLAVLLAFISPSKAITVTQFDNQTTACSISSEGTCKESIFHGTHPSLFSNSLQQFTHTEYSRTSEKFIKYTFFGKENIYNGQYKQEYCSYIKALTYCYPQYLSKLKRLNI